MRYLTIEQLLSELEHRPGLVPIDLDSTKRHLVWLDFDTYHFYEGFFHKSLDRFIAIKKSRPTSSAVVTFVTDLNVLRDPRIITDSIYPNAFIFHAGRCGSTLLARVLAGNRRHLVISEAPTHNQIWLTLVRADSKRPEATEENKQIYKRLILAVGRRRLPEHHLHFIKFTSFNILFFEFIRSVFPDVPAIFLYREPGPILDSFVRNPPGWLTSKDEALAKLLDSFLGDKCEPRSEQSTAQLLIEFFEAGLRAASAGARLLNYSALNSQNLPAILDALGIPRIGTTNQQLALMRNQFQFSSKEDYRLSVFSAPSSVERHKRNIAPQLMESLEKVFEELRRCDSNVVRGDRHTLPANSP